MNYPNGKEMRVGDLVWWNEGVCVGFVEEIITDPMDFGNWHVDGPSIALTNLHPFEANQIKHKQHIGYVATGGTTVYPESTIKDEGIGLLSENERREFDWATSQAKERVSDVIAELPFCVCAHLDMERKEEDWHFHFVDQECKVVESVVFPFRPETRSGEG